MEPVTVKPKETDPDWEQLNLSGLSGTLLVVGPTDGGKTTFSRSLFKRLSTIFPRVAYLDGDPGQSTLGPPGTMTLALAETGDDSFPPKGRMWRGFVGSVSPTGHMLHMLTCGARLIGAAREASVQVVVYDTTGLIDPAKGGLHLKLAKIDLLRPAVLFAIQRDQELKSLLLPLRRSRRITVVELPRSPAVQQRDLEARKGHRAAQFAHYFTDATELRVSWARFAVFPAPRFSRHQLVALEDAHGFTIGLGIVEQTDRINRQIVLNTPVASTHGVDAIRLGNLAVDPETFEDRPLLGRN